MKRDSIVRSWNPESRVLTFTDKASGKVLREYDTSGYPDMVQAAALGLGYRNKLGDANAMAAGTDLQVRLAASDAVHESLGKGDWERKPTPLTEEEKYEALAQEVAKAFMSIKKTDEKGFLTFVAQTIKNNQTAGQSALPVEVIVRNMAKRPAIAAEIAKQRAESVTKVEGLTFDGI